MPGDAHLSSSAPEAQGNVNDRSRVKEARYPAVMSTPTAFNALAKLPQTGDSLEQISTALQAEHEHLESRLGIVQEARRLAEGYPVDSDGNPGDEVWPHLISYLEA